MTASPGTAPYRILLDRPYGCVVVAAASLMLSLWAIYLDPVINSDGVGEIRAARHFSAAQWGAGLEVADRPFYAVLVALVSRLTGLSAGYSAYALGAGFHALLALGFVALSAALGGDRRAQGLAALVVLLYPALNGLRSTVAGDAAYWAFYVWSLAWFMHYASTGRRCSLGIWAVAGLAALMFRLEALVFLSIVPLWLVVQYRAGGRGAVVKIPVIAAGAGVLLCYTLWQQALLAGAPAASLLLSPFDHLAAGWHDAGRALRFKMEALRGEFLDPFSQGYDRAALLATVVLISAAGLVKGLGLLHAGLSLYAIAALKRLLAPPARYWWTVFAILGAILLLVPASTAFSLDHRDAMTAALTLLAIVPLGLESLRRTWSEHRVYRHWAFPAVLALVLVAGIAGLDVRTDQLQLREAGLWLRANAPPGSDLYSNSEIVVYYSGLNGYRQASTYSWRHAMNTVHRGQWREYDYLALAVTRANRHREAMLARKLDIEPVRIVANDDGDRVLIFRTDN